MLWDLTIETALARFAPGVEPKNACRPGDSVPAHVMFHPAKPVIAIGMNQAAESVVLIGNIDDNSILKRARGMVIK